MKGYVPIYMQQMCPVQYTYPMLGKHELHHTMQKTAERVTFTISVLFKSSLWHVTTLSFVNRHKRPTEQNFKTSPKRGESLYKEMHCLYM